MFIMKPYWADFMISCFLHWSQKTVMYDYVDVTLSDHSVAPTSKKKMLKINWSLFNSSKTTFEWAELCNISHLYFLWWWMMVFIIACMAVALLRFHIIINTVKSEEQTLCHCLLLGCETMAYNACFFYIFITKKYLNKPFIQCYIKKLLPRWRINWDQRYTSISELLGELFDQIWMYQRLCYGTVTVSWYSDSVMVQWLCHGTVTVMVQWLCHGTVIVSWYSDCVFVQ